MEKVFYGDKLNTVRGAQPQVLITSQPTNTPPECAVFRKTAHPRDAGGVQGYEMTDKADTLNIYDNTETRTPILVVNAIGSDGGV